jgi:hypothetical protein
MNTKAILIAAVLTVVLIIVGLFQSGDEGSRAATPEADTAFFPGLYDHINDVTAMQVATTEGEFNVRRTGDAWTLDEKSGYHVQVDQVRQSLIALAEMETVEQKTDNPARYVELGVQPVGEAPDAETQSKSITLMNDEGETVAAVLVGKTRGGGRGGTFYVRRPSEAASWLVKGQLPPLPADAAEWLDKKIIEVKRDEVRAARVSHADGEVITISKEDSDTNFTLHELPADRELAYTSAPDSIAGALQYMNFEEVERRESFEAPEEVSAVTNLWTKDGMRVTVQLWDKDEVPYASFEATYDLDGVPSLELAPMPPTAEDEGAEAAAVPRPREEVEAEIVALNTRLSPWVFKLPAYSKTNLTKRVDGMLKPLPTPEETTLDEEGAADPEAPIDIDSLGGALEQPAQGTPPSDG